MLVGEGVRSQEDKPQVQARRVESLPFQGLRHMQGEGGGGGQHGGAKILHDLQLQSRRDGGRRRQGGPEEFGGVVEGEGAGKEAEVKGHLDDVPLPNPQLFIEAHHQGIATCRHRAA